MTLLARTLLVPALALGAFAWWGIFTPSGSRTFDEMDGMIPFGAGLLAVLLLISAGAADLLARRRR